MKLLHVYDDVQLYESDVALFHTNQWLNDNAINFYLQHLQHTICCKNNEVVLMDPTVVSCMVLQCDDGDEFADLARGIQLAEKQVCFIPVSDNQSLGGSSSHWSLCVYRRASAVLEHYDSCAGSNHAAAKRVAKQFQSLLANEKGEGVGSNECLTVKEMSDSPQQENGYDCGVYVLAVADYLCKKEVGMQLEESLQEYVTPKKVTDMREQIPQIVNRVVQQHLKQ